MQKLLTFFQQKTLALADYCVDPGSRAGCVVCGVCVVVVLLFYVHSKHLRSCRDGQLT